MFEVMLSKICLKVPYYRYSIVNYVPYTVISFVLTILLPNSIGALLSALTKRSKWNKNKVTKFSGQVQLPYCVRISLLRHVTQPDKSFIFYVVAGRLGPGDVWALNFGPRGHLGPGDVWAQGTFGPRRRLGPTFMGPSFLLKILWCLFPHSHSEVGTNHIT